MKRRNSIITLLLALAMVFSSSAFAVFADTTPTQDGEKLDADTPATEEVVEEPAEGAAVTEQAEEVPEQGLEAGKPEGELKPAEESTVKNAKYDYISINEDTGADKYKSDEVKYDGKGTLTLKNYHGEYIVFGGIDLNIVLQDSNTVGAIFNDGKNTLTISGSGTLNIDGESGPQGTELRPLGLPGGLSSDAVIIKSGTIVIKNAFRGISANNTLITGGTVTINDVVWAMTAKSEDVASSKISIQGGTVNACGSLVGLFAGTIDISGGVVKAKGLYGIAALKKLSFSGDTYVDAEANGYRPSQSGDGDNDLPAVFSGGNNTLSLSDDVQVVLPESSKLAPYELKDVYYIDDLEGTMIADASGKPAKHVIIDRVKNPSGVLIAKAVAKGKTSLALSWTAMNDVDGYDVFFAKCNSKGKTYAPELVASVKAGTTSYTVSGLTKGTAYKAYVQAYIMKQGSKQYVGTSLSAHAYAGGSNKKYTNAKSVKVKKSKVSIKKGKTYKIKATVKKLKKSKKLMHKGHAPKLRYLSSNTSIATVTKKGTIKAVAPGTCTVYAIASSGAYKAVNVTVK